MSLDYAAIDFELANNSDPHAACSVGLVVVRNGAIVDKYYTLINPQASFNPYCVHVHGIQAKDVADAPLFPDIWPEIQKRIAGLPIVAHNKSCDLRALRGCLDYYSIDLICRHHSVHLLCPSISFPKSVRIAFLPFAGQ